MRLNTINTLVPSSSHTGLLLLGTGVLIGRNYIRGIGSKIGGIIADKLGTDPTTWNQSSENYFELAKTHTFRDLKLVAGLAVLYAAIEMKKHSEDLETFEPVEKKTTLPPNGITFRPNHIEEMCALNEEIEVSDSCDHLKLELENCTKLFEDYRSLKKDYFFLQLYSILVGVASIFSTYYNLKQ
jgi:hypothetical protein